MKGLQELFLKIKEPSNTLVFWCEADCNFEGLIECASQTPCMQCLAAVLLARITWQSLAGSKKAA